MDIETVKGIARNVRHTTEVHGSKKSTSTSHIALLDIDKHVVSVETGDPVHIQDGEEVVVAGQRGKDGVFHGYSYRNVTKGVVGHSFSDQLRKVLWFLLVGGVVTFPLGGVLIVLGWLVMIWSLRGPRAARKVLTSLV